MFQEVIGNKDKINLPLHYHCSRVWVTGSRAEIYCRRKNGHKRAKAFHVILQNLLLLKKIIRNVIDASFPKHLGCFINFSNEVYSNFINLNLMWPFSLKLICELFELLNGLNIINQKIFILITVWIEN